MYLFKRRLLLDDVFLSQIDRPSVIRRSSSEEQFNVNYTDSYVNN